MKPLVPAYKRVGERRYREISGLYYEDFEPGDVFEHRPGRTILDVGDAIVGDSRRHRKLVVERTVDPRKMVRPYVSTETHESRP